jgi:Prokaryotic E2 family E
MEERVRAEIALLKGAFPDLEVRDDLWCRFAVYVLPPGIWSVDTVELAFQIPPNLPGQQPYAFWVKPSIRLASDALPTNYNENIEIPFGSGYGQFSWAPEVWAPVGDSADIQKGSNMVNFVHSFAARLRDAS